METTKKTLKISFSTQKGGVGKSTMTTLLASVLHYRLGFNVLVMDCDFPQHSLTNMRERDKRTIMQNDYHKKAAMKQFQAINKKAYPIIKCKAETALEKASEYRSQSAVVPDVIFFDLPGTANTKGVLTTLKNGLHLFAHYCRPFGSGKYIGLYQSLSRTSPNGRGQSRTRDVAVLEPSGWQGKNRFV